MDVSAETGLAVGGRPWDRFLTPEDRAVFAQSGYGARQGLGRRPCVLVVDVTVGGCHAGIVPYRGRSRAHTASRRPRRAQSEWNAARRSASASASR